MKKFIIFPVVIILSACTWVDLSKQGEKVKLATAADVTQCKLLGSTNATTQAVVAGVRRHQNAIDYELSTLARNAAVNLEGDTVVAQDREVDGKQTFNVYRCSAP